eukprot:Rhum_TRINITY_DN14508_c14_g1::Rhum_TRINITY_DN14508_c14_g1_i1::g.94768::m.94768
MKNARGLLGIHFLYDATQLVLAGLQLVHRGVKLVKLLVDAFEGGCRRDDPVLHAAHVLVHLGEVDLDALLRLQQPLHRLLPHHPLRKLLELHRLSQRGWLRGLPPAHRPAHLQQLAQQHHHLAFAGAARRFQARQLVLVLVDDLPRPALNGLLQVVFVDVAHDGNEHVDQHEVREEEAEQEQQRPHQPRVLAERRVVPLPEHDLHEADERVAEGLVRVGRLRQQQVEAEHQGERNHHEDHEEDQHLRVADRRGDGGGDGAELGQDHNVLQQLHEVEHEHARPQLAFRTGERGHGPQVVEDVRLVEHVLRLELHRLCDERDAGARNHPEHDDAHQVHQVPLAPEVVRHAVPHVRQRVEEHL